KEVYDLKGKRIGVTTVGSLTDWIGKRIGVVKGWGPRGIDIVAIGGMEPARAAMKTNQIDGYISSLESGFALEEAKEWRVITTATPFVDHFITHVFFAREEVIEKRPPAVPALLQAWFNAIAFMKANKAKTVDITAKVLNLSPAVIGRAYEEEVGIFSDDGVLAHYREVRDKYVNTAAPPASTTIGLPQLARPGALFEIEAIAVLPPK